MPSKTPSLRRSNTPFSLDPIWEEIASWGTARLLKDLDGNYELIGGSEQDRKAAEEWIALFIYHHPPAPRP